MNTPSLQRPLLRSIVAALLLSACANQKKGTHPPRSEAWASALDQHLANQKQTPVVQRDRALLASGFMAKAPKEERFESLSNPESWDALTAYAVASRAMRSHDLDALLSASRRLLEIEATGSNAATTPEKYASPATAQVLGWLWSQLQDLPPRHNEVDALWSKYKEASLSPYTRRALLSLVGRSKRLAHEPFAFAYQAQGCVQAWEASPVQGSLGPLSLTRAKLDRFALPDAQHPAAPVFGLACATRVWNPTEEAGYVQLRRDLVLDKPGFLLSVSTPATTRVMVDGQEIWRNDQQTSLASRDVELYVDVPAGQHRLEIAVAVPGDKEWMVVRATDLEGRALPQRTASGQRAAGKSIKVSRRDTSVAQGCRRQLSSGDLSDPLLAEPWIAHCTLAHALEQYDHESSMAPKHALEAFEAFAEGRAMLADQNLQDPELTDNAGRSAAHQYLTESVKMDASLLGLRIALENSRNARGEEAQVRDALKALPAPTHVSDALFRFGVYLEVGDELQADQMLRAAQDLSPHHCEVVAAQFRRARDLDARTRQAALLPKLDQCPGARVLALRFWMNRGNHEKARAIADSLLQEGGDDVDRLFRRVEIAQNQGDWAQAQKDLEQILKLQTASLRAHLKLADKDRSEGKLQEARELFVKLAERFPNENHLRRYLEELGVPDPLMQERVDGLALIKDYLNPKSNVAPLFSKDSAVYLLDRDYVHVYNNGSQRHLIHQIVRVQTKEGIDAYGEITVPEGAELLRLRTIKKDGRIIEPERTPGKSSYSMRALELGDFVEQEWLLPAQWAQARRGSTDLGVFRFASTRAPFVRSELVVRAPNDLGLEMELSNGAPSPTIKEQGADRTWHFVVNNQPRVVPEPSTPNMGDVIPQVRCHANLDAQQWLDELVASTQDARRRGPTLRAQVKALTEGKKDPMAKVRAIYDKVHEHIESDGDLGRNVNRSLTTGKGNRSNLMYAMLREAKIPVRLLVARSRFSPRLGTPQGHPQFESYETPILELWPNDKKKRRYLLADLAFAPLGYLPSWFDGALAFPLAEPDEPNVREPIRLDKGLQAHQELRSYSLDIRLDRQGNANVDATLTIRGLYAAQWREALKQSDPERYQEIFAQYELPRFFPGKSPKIETFAIKNAKNRQEPLQINFRLSVPGLAAQEGQGLSLSSFFMHLNPGSNLARLDKRKLDLAVTMSGHQKATIQVTLPKGLQWSASPQKALSRDVTGGFGRYEQRADQKGDRLSLEIQSELTPQVVKAERYPDFVRFVRSVAEAQVHRIQATPSNS